MSDRNFRLKGGKIALGPTYTPAPPLLPPTAPVLMATGTSVCDLSWDATGVWYEVYRDGGLFTITEETSLSISGMGNSDRTFFVVAKNNQGSATSNTVAFRSLAPVWDGLLYYWAFDGASTTPSDADYYGKESHGGQDFTKNAAGPDSQAAGKLGRAIGLTNSTSNYFTLSGSGASPFIDVLYGVTGFSCCAWVKAEASGAVLGQILKSGTSAITLGSAVQLDATDNGGGAILLRATVNNTVPTSFTVDTTVAPSQWHFYCGGYDPQTQLPFVSVNGGAKIWGSTPLTGQLRQSNLMFGTCQLSGTRLVVIDELSLFEGVLDDDQIAALYNSGAGLSYPFP